MTNKLLHHWGFIYRIGEIEKRREMSGEKKTHTQNVITVFKAQ